MIPEVHYEIRDLKNKVKDLRSTLDAIQELYDMYQTGVIKEEQKFIQEVGRHLKKNE
jgi:hypothetical protein